MVFEDSMLDTFYERVFSSCLGSIRNICVLLQDDVLDDTIDVWSLTMKTIAPQNSVSVFEFDALNDQIDEESVASSMTDRIRNFSSASLINDGRKPISTIYFATSILEELILVIYNAENLNDEFYKSIEKIERALRVSGKGRLRVLLVGTDAIIPMVAKNTSGFNKVKWYNHLKDPEYAEGMLDFITNKSINTGKVLGVVADDLIVFGKML